MTWIQKMLICFFVKALANTHVVVKLENLLQIYIACNLHGQILNYKVEFMLFIHTTGPFCRLRIN